jgi:hypothetical protein
MLQFELKCLTIICQFHLRQFHLLRLVLSAHYDKPVPIRDSTLASMDRIDANYLKHSCSGSCNGLTDKKLAIRNVHSW